METNRQCVYRIVHVGSGDCYVGSSKNYTKRWHDHRSSLRRGVHRNKRLQRAWNLYGEHEFAFEVLERVVGESSMLLGVEQRHINMLRPAFNIHPIAVANGRYMPPLPLESRKLISEKHKRRFADMSAEERALWRVRLAKARALVPPPSDELRTKISVRSKGLWDSAKSRGVTLGGKPLGVTARDPKPKTCVVCGLENPVRVGRKRACSKACGKVLRMKSRRAYNSRVEDRVCEICERPFSAMFRKTTKTCSKRCAALMWRRSSA